jgi:cysteine synthase
MDGSRCLGPDAVVVTVMCDTGMKYLKTFGARLEARVPT